MAYNKVVFGDRVLIDLTGDTVKPEHLLAGSLAHDSEGNLIGGEIPLVESEQFIITQKDDMIQIQEGYHDGSDTIMIDEENRNLIVPENIRNGVTILGETGTMFSADDITSQEKTVTPTAMGQTVNPDPGYNFLTWVTIEPISLVEEPNEAGGTTVTIGRDKY